MKVPIMRTRGDAPLPKYETSGACCFDIVCVEDAVVQPRTIAFLPTGLVFCVPDGYMLMVASRSSTPFKKGLMMPHGIGIIDQDYCGPGDELKLEVYNFTDGPVEVKKGDRVCQAGFVRIDRCDWAEYDAGGAKTRGGLGSTGPASV